MTFRPRERLIFAGFHDAGYFDASEVREALRAACANHGSLRKWARKHHVSPTFVSAVLTGRKVPSEKVLKPLGFVRFVLYRKKEQPSATGREGSLRK